jgi:branched-chain amino acid transport system substrate-binding protein
MSTPRTACCRSRRPRPTRRFTERKLWNVFRTCGRDDQQGASPAPIIAEKLRRQEGRHRPRQDHLRQGPRRRDAEGDERQGRQGGLYEGVNTGEKDFSALISKLKAAGVDVVYWGGLHTEGGLIVRQMRDQGVKATMMSGDGIADRRVRRHRRPRRRRHADDLPAGSAQAPRSAAIVEKFRTARKFEPQAYTLYSYAAVQILKQAAERRQVDSTRRRSPRSCTRASRSRP